ncbi:outer membrane protein [Pseudaestuariivita rosea]|uniref:outer membrane protein n=1 Tax=Pseudaestuariivita rosea TaxID=2763263 RepID=UPI001ABA92ED|nr:outer membrane beta-barrel protein [Pseudaestuariivita rosea]
MKNYIMICAAGMTFMLPQMTFAQDWTGLYIGAQGGYSSYGEDENTNISFDGLQYGILGGYSVLSGGLYIAGEAEFSLSNVGAESSIDSLGISASVDETSIGSISLIIGGLTTPNTLIYGKVGAFSTNFEAKVDTPLFDIDTDETGTGYKLGIGAEFVSQNNISFRGEVSYFNGSVDIDGLPDGIEYEGGSLSLGVISRF